jgi:hypothetical protein
MDVMGLTNSALSTTIGPTSTTMLPTLYDHATAANYARKCAQKSLLGQLGIRQSSAASTSTLSTCIEAVVRCGIYYMHMSQQSSGQKLMLPNATPLKHGPILFIKTL